MSDKKSPKSYRLSNDTLSKLAELKELTGFDATELIEKAVEHYYPTGKREGTERIKRLLVDKK